MQMIQSLYLKEDNQSFTPSRKPPPVPKVQEVLVQVSSQTCSIKTPTTD
tara:strand:+ start:297 stop:443 length:147 start_codon:yes stop_codon:yes gene_type:complete